jgi:replication initiation protein RepC
MERGQVTTPFGRRPMSLALLKQQVRTTQIESQAFVDKWKVFRAACAAKHLLNLHDRSLAVLDALLSFHPDSELRGDARLVVFPSNEQLAVRAHGIAGATLRRHLSILVDAGLIIRKDSANGKRYARKSRAGQIEDAFGFDLSPMLTRAPELFELAQNVAAERLEFRRTKEELTICRRDIRKLIAAAIEEGAKGDWARIEQIYGERAAAIPRSPRIEDITALLAEMTSIRDEIIRMLNFQDYPPHTSGNDAQDERHIQNSESDNHIEFEDCSGKEPEGKSEPVSPATSVLKAFPLAMVLRACPQILDYSRGRIVADWRDLMSAAVTVRTMLGVSAGAYQSACEAMGPENAAVSMACILERAEHINSPGGYLRDLTRKAKSGEFSLGPMLMALLRSNEGLAQRAG